MVVESHERERERERDDMSVSRVALTGGGEVVVIHRRKTSDRALVVVVFTKTTLSLICGLCAASCCLGEGENFEDASEWLHKHSRSLVNGRGKVLPHQLDELLSQKALAELMVEAVGATSTRDVFSKRRSRLLPKSQLLQILGSDVVLSLTLTPNVTVSRCCLSREGRCCVGRTQMTVD